MSGVQSIVRDKAGNAIASAQVTVHPAGSAGLADLFTDPQLLDPQPNPFTADSSGYYSFYAAAGFYDIEFAKQGFPTVTLTEVELPYSSAGGEINGNVTINGNLVVNGTISGPGFDHGSLLGLLDDDHPQYLLIDGTRAMTGTLDMGGNNVVGIDDLLGQAGPPGSGIRFGDANVNIDGDAANLGVIPRLSVRDDRDAIECNAPLSTSPAGPARIQVEKDFDMNGQTITELADPTAAQQAATKAYVDTLASTWQVSLGVLQSIPDAAPTKVAFDTIDLDEASAISIVAGGTVRLTLDGLWVFGASISFAASAVGQRKATIFESVLPTLDVLGFAIAPAAVQPGSGTGFTFPARPYQVTGPQEFDINVFQDSGGPLDLNGGPALNVIFWGHRLRP